MVDTAPNRPSPDATHPDLPDHSVVPGVWSRITNLDVDQSGGVDVSSCSAVLGRL